MTHEQFYKLCIANKDVAMERSLEGELMIMPPVGSESGSDGPTGFGFLALVLYSLQAFLCIEQNRFLL